jgi:predicted SnoaL-like aldol condensation-catalyzing enzyme
MNATLSNPTEGTSRLAFDDHQRDGLGSQRFGPEVHESSSFYDRRLHAGLARVSAGRSQRSESKNKALVLNAFDTLFNKRDYTAAERFWSADYIQHSAHIAPGRDGLINLVKNAPPTLKYEPGMIAADGDLVIIHGRFSGLGQPVNWVGADILRVKDGILVEHWDVIQDEATQEQSKSGLPMFGDTFPK